MKNTTRTVCKRQFYRRVAASKQQFLSEVGVCASSQSNSNLNINSSVVNVESSEIDEPAAEGNNSDILCINSDNNIFFSNFCIDNEINDNFSNVVHTDNSSEISMTDKLRHWAITSSVTHSSISSLLHILSSYHPELPLDSRTLLKTPTNFVYKTLETGQYCHFGLLNGIKHQMSIISQHSFEAQTLHLSFNVDGIPLYNSTNTQLWPILCQIKNKFKHFLNTPFAVGVFCGNSKPVPLQVYLEDLIRELNELLKLGLHFEGKHYFIEIHSFICDAPARAYLKCVKSHGGYSSCDKCTDHGVMVEGRVIMKNIFAPLRTDASFLQKTDENHHLNISPLEQLPIGLVSRFPIDYMHNVCLGVVRKLLNSWLGGPLQVRLGSKRVQSISEVLVSLKKYIAVEFNRKPRSLSELARWKATEFRTFLLYLGPLVLKTFTDAAVYEHFLLLHCGITILISSTHLSKFGANYAGKLLKVFVQHSEKIYGLTYLIYNVHLLSHLSDDVKLFGPLDNISAFPFENYLAHLKRLVKSTINPLREIHNRIKETEFLYVTSLKEKFISSEPTMEHFSGPLIGDNMNNCKQFKKIILNQCSFSLYSHSPADCYCLIEKSVIEIHNIVKTGEGKIFIIGKKFCNYEALYNYPFCSKELDIHIVSRLSKNFYMYLIDDIASKCMLFPYTTNTSSSSKRFVSIPIVHSLI